MRRNSITVDVGGIPVGGDHPIVVQSMTNTDTADADATAIQVARLAHAGSELVRVTVNTEEAAAAVPRWSARSAAWAWMSRSSGTSTTTGTSCSWNIPRRPPCSPSTGSTRATSAPSGDEHFATIVKVAIDNDRPVRIGVNWGSLDQAVLTELMDANAQLSEPRDSRDVMIEAMLQSALRSAELAEATGLGHDRIIISAKVSGVRDLVDVYRLLAARCDYPLHLGLTEAGMGDKGVIASTAGLAIAAARGDRRHDPRLAHPGTRRPASAKSRSPSRSSSRWVCARSCPRSRPARMPVVPRRRSSRRWRSDPGLPQGPDAGVEGDSSRGKTCAWR